MKIQGTINLDVRDISMTFDYGRVILNAGNKQVSISLTQEAAEQLQYALCEVLPDTTHSKMYRSYKNITLMDRDLETVEVALQALKDQGKINKDVTTLRLTTEECDLINEWRIQYYKEVHDKE